MENQIMKYLLMLMIGIFVVSLSGCVNVDIDADAGKWKAVGDEYKKEYTGTN